MTDRATCSDVKARRLGFKNRKRKKIWPVFAIWSSSAARAGGGFRDLRQLPAVKCEISCFFIFMKIKKDTPLYGLKIEKDTPLYGLFKP